MSEVYVALGSNLHHPSTQLSLALQALQVHPKLQIQQSSRLYRSQPMGPDQPMFTNAMCRLSVAVSPMALLQLLQAIEAEFGRRSTRMRWGPRVIDLDLIYWQGVTMATEDLVLPHAGCWQRLFVLCPWLDVAAHQAPLAASIRAAILKKRKMGLGPGTFMGRIPHISAVEIDQ
jgi:2-amino-4-hydroxy-6-hydroxymethyldihydropteridine diphosphokinase